jgi:hypothetical protein
LSTEIISAIQSRKSEERLVATGEIEFRRSFLKACQFRRKTFVTNSPKLRLNGAARAADAAREVTERWLPGG